MNIKFLSRKQHNEDHSFLHKTMNMPATGSGAQTPEYRSSIMPPVPDNLKVQPNCNICRKSYVCKYKKRYNTLKKALKPLKINCELFDAVWGGVRFD